MAPARSSRYPLRLLTALLVFAIMFVGAFALSTLPSAQASLGCPNAIFIGARGSGEPIESSSHGLGDAVNIMASTMNADLGAHGLTMRTFADPYPADPVSDLYPSRDEAITMATALAPVADTAWAGHVHKYFRSIDTGVADAISAAEQDVVNCPGAALVFAGYSQGAMVMHQAELKLVASHETNVLNHIAGTLLLGDGDRVPNTKATQFGTSKHGEGVQTYLYRIAHVSTHDVESPSTTANICDEDDIVCDFDPKRLLRDHNPLAIVAAFKHAGEVHTHYATTEKQPLEEAADWLAAKIITADSPAPLSPQPAPIPPPTPPAPSVPSTGPTLVYDGDTALPLEEDSSDYTGDHTFYNWSTATGEPAEVTEVLPSSITSDRCIVLLANESLGESNELELADYLHQGGTIVALGEHEGGGYNIANETLSRFAKSVGVGLSLVDGYHDYGQNTTYDIDPSPLTENVTSLSDNWVSTLEVSGAAESLAGTADGEGTLIGAQSVATGQFVMTGDSNLFTDEAPGTYEDNDNGQLARNLCP